MSDFTNSPQSEQEKYLGMMPNYGQVPDSEFRVGFGRRFGAAILDVIFVSIVMLFAMMFFGIFDAFEAIDWEYTLANPGEMELEISKLTQMVTPLSLAIGFLYYSMEMFFAATPGKMILGIKIAKANRVYADFKDLLVRFALKNSPYIFTALYAITWTQMFSTLQTVMSFAVLVAFFFVLGNDKLSLYDKIAGTAVYYKDEIKTNEEQNVTDTNL